MKLRKQYEKSIALETMKKYSKHIEGEKCYFEHNYKYLIDRSKYDFIWSAPEKLIFIDTYLALKKDWVLLDLGCGAAENSRKNILPLINTETKYIGVDISKKLLKEAKLNIPTGYFYESPMGDLNIPNESVDFVCFFGSLHHDEFPAKTIRKIAGFLRKNGIVFLREPQEKIMKKGFGESPYEAGINPKILKKWLTSAGFNILEWHYLNTMPFHFIRKVITRLGLGGLEKTEVFWTIKTRIELILEKFFIGRLKPYEGTDMFIVAQKTSGDVKNDRGLDNYETLCPSTIL